MTRACFFIFALVGCRTYGLGGPTGAGTDAGTDGATHSCAAHTDYDSCTTDPACYANACPNPCPGGGSGFIACYDNGVLSGTPSCPAIECVQDCTAHADEVGCEADRVCFAVFSADGKCNTSGCPRHFDHCQNAPATCALAGFPDFGGVPISCSPGFVPLLEDGCIVTGCVREATCWQPD